MNVDLANSQGGLGDHIQAAWLLEGLRAMGVEATFWARNVRAASLFWDKVEPYPIAPKEDAADFGRNWWGQMRDEANGKTRLDHWARMLPKAILRDFGKPKAMRPKLRIAPEFRHDLAGAVLLFPQTMGQERKWTNANWGVLAHLLEAEGFRVVPIFSGMRKGAERKWRAVFNGSKAGEAAIFDLPWAQIAGALLSCKFGVGVDSMPAHFAGTLGTRFAAICGSQSGKAIFGEYFDGGNFQTVEAEKECAPCFLLKSRGWNRHNCAGICPALREISALKVFNALADFRQT